MVLDHSNTVPKLHGQSSSSTTTFLLKKGSRKIISYQCVLYLDQRSLVTVIPSYGHWFKSSCNWQLASQLSTHCLKYHSISVPTYFLFLETSLLWQWQCEWKGTMPSYHAACAKFRVSGMIYQRHTMFRWTGTSSLQPHPANMILLHFLFIFTRCSSSKLKQFKMPPLLLLWIGSQLSMASKASCFWVVWPLCLSQLQPLQLHASYLGQPYSQPHPPVDRKIQRSWASKVRTIHFWRVHGKQLEQQQLLWVILYLLHSGPDLPILLQMDLM